jgi:hypothetical protein
MKPGERYWSILTPFADALSISAKSETLLREMAMIPQIPRNLFAANWCVAEVCNGGFEQFFFNSTGVLGPEAADAFEAIGLPLLSKAVLTAMSFFGDAYPRDRIERQDRLQEIQRRSDRENIFDSIDKEFYALLASEGGGWEVAADAYAIMA